MKLEKIFLFLLFSIIICWVTPSLEAQVNIQEDPNVSRVIKWYKQLKSNENEIEGWAVQIISTRDRREMEEARNRFQLRYPQHSIKNDYIEPLYRIRVGKFINKLNALSLRSELRNEFRSALLVSQKFNRSDFY